MHLPLQSSTDTAAATHVRAPPEVVATAGDFEAKPAPKLHPAATPPNESGAVPVIIGSNEPTALSSFNRRHMAETYSSDDDDVFLPNPPSKGQADQCTAESGVGLQAPQIVVIPDRGEEEEEEEQGKQEKGEPMEVLDNSATAGKCSCGVKILGSGRGFFVFFSYLACNYCMWFSLQLSISNLYKTWRTLLPIHSPGLP